MQSKQLKYAINKTDDEFADKLLDMMYAEGPAGAAVMNKKGTILIQGGIICIA